ncbi:MAG: hypothetical protein AAFR57_05135 [Pseudomonadota bacterium]
MRKLTMCALIGGVALAGQAAVANPAPNNRCGPRDAVINHLTANFGESRQSMGLQRNGVVEVFSSEETGSWTIIITSAQGVSCLIAAGRAWDLSPEPLAALDRKI